jgi:hypothetical protein
MKTSHISPSEVMYTSLMTYASQLATTTKATTASQDKSLKDMQQATAVLLYSELMASVIGKKSATETVSSLFGGNKKSNDEQLLFQVSLLFQEMETSGVQPDLATYNVLL